MLPEKTPDGYSVVMTGLLDFNPNNYNQLNSIRVFDMIVMTYLHQNGPIKGILIVIDMKGSVFGHLARMNLMAFRKYLYYLQVFG